ncbi:glycosyltransferase family 2 protein [soil metagenome]
MDGLLTFWRVFGFVIAVLVVSLVALFTAHAALAWTVGIIYIGYDTWLLSRMISLSRAALREKPTTTTATEKPTMTVLVAARNECPVLPTCLDSLLQQEDGAEEIWVIDDGSQDGTREMLAKRYGVSQIGERGQSATHAGLRLWSKESTGKAKSFNAILPDCTGDLVVTIDADTVIAPGSLKAFREAFARDGDLAAGCGILVPQCKAGGMGRYFEFFQQFEYLRAFLWRLAWSRLNALVLVSGAFAVYRREVLSQLGGFDAGSWVEDYELLYRLHRVAGMGELKWDVRVITGARAVTDAPAAPRQFLRQRSRWFGGFLATLFANKAMVGHPRFGGMGRLLLPVKVIDTLLPLFAAIAQVALVVLLVRGNFLSGPLIALIAGKLLFDLVMHLWAMRLYARWLDLPCTAGWMAKSVAASLLEPFCFQPLRYTGALAGWVAFLANRFSWESQRLEPNVVPVAEQTP